MATALLVLDVCFSSFSYFDLSYTLTNYSLYLFHNYMLNTVQVSLTQARIDMSELDEDSDGFLQSNVSTQVLLPANGTALSSSLQIVSLLLLL